MSQPHNGGGNREHQDAPPANPFDPPNIQEVEAFARGLYIDYWRSFGARGRAVYETQGTVAERHGVSVKAIYNREQELRKAGVVTIKRSGKGPGTSRVILFNHRPPSGTALPDKRRQEQEQHFQVGAAVTGTSMPPTRKVGVVNSEDGFHRSTERQLTTAAGKPTEPDLSAVVDLVEGSEEGRDGSEHDEVVKRLCAEVLEPAGVSAASCRDVPGILLGRLKDGWEEPELATRLRQLESRAQRPTVDNPPGFLIMLLRTELAHAAPPALEDTASGKNAMEVEGRRRRVVEAEKRAKDDAAELETYRATGTTPGLDRLREQADAGDERAAAGLRMFEQEYAEKAAKLNSGGEAGSSSHA